MTKPNLITLTGPSCSREKCDYAGDSASKSRLQNLTKIYDT